MKKLYRSRDNTVLTGLLGGIGEYFTIDPVWIRFVFVVILIFSEVWPAVLVYVIGFLMVPKAPEIEIIATDASKDADDTQG